MRNDTILSILLGLLLIAALLLTQTTAAAADPYTELMHRFERGYDLPEPVFALEQAGKPGPVDFAKYGTLHNVGTADYRYELTDPEGLVLALGAGFYPNPNSVLSEPEYAAFKLKGLLDRHHWDALESDNLQAAFYIWARAAEDPGVRTYFTAKILERAGLIRQALKGYQLCVTVYPRSAGWGRGGDFVWYIGPAAIADIKRLCRDYPQLGLNYTGAEITVDNGDDVNLDNDVVTVTPGQFVPQTLEQRLKAYPDLTQLKITERRPSQEVEVVQYANGHWQLRVQGRPYVVRGITYQPTRIGLGPNHDAAFLGKWMFTDTNENAVNDAALESWVDFNRNGRQDRDEPNVGDFQLLEDLGVNTLRLYLDTPGVEYNPDYINKPLLRKLYRDHGIRIIVGNFLGAYLQGSGASWDTGTDYTDPKQRHYMKQVVKAMVEDLKDEPFVLMWLLGNENNMPGHYYGVNATRTNAANHPRAYAEFLNEIAEMIYEIDGDHPVAVGNIELGLTDYYARYAPAIDILGVNSYRGPHGFDNLWREARRRFDRPVLITEYGHDAFHQGEGENEVYQLKYHEGCLRDIVFNQAGGRYEGNAIGGVIFEFLDEWWKNTAGDPEDLHSVTSQVRLPFSDGISHEEWLGIISQGSGRNSPFERRLRKAYYFYKGVWE